MDLDEILEMQDDDVTQLRRRNLNLISEIAVLKEHKAILYEMVKILYEVIKKFGEKCNRSIDIQESLMNSMNYMATAIMCPEALTNPQVRICIKDTPKEKREAVITEKMLKNGIKNIEEINIGEKRLIQKF